MSKKIIICLMGEPQSGKSTVARIMQEHTGWKSGTCSSVIYNVLSKLDNLPPGDWHEVNPPETHDAIRQRLIALGNAMSDEVPFIYPVALMNAGCQILDGVRRKHELEALKEYCAANDFRLIRVHVSRPNRPKIKDNNELSKEPVDCLICARDLKELENQILYFINAQCGVDTPGWRYPGTGSNEHYTREPENE